MGVGIVDDGTIVLTYSLRSFRIGYFYFWRSSVDDGGDDDDVYLFGVESTEAFM